LITCASVTFFLLVIDSWFIWSLVSASSFIKMVNLGEAAIRAPFLLAAEEEVDIMAVASTSVALLGLTITPSVPPDAVSGDWTYGGMGGGHLSRTI